MLGMTLYNCLSIGAIKLKIIMPMDCSQQVKLISDEH
jgi:hypothetical protein